MHFSRGPLGRRKRDIALIPPIQLSHVLDATACEPRLVAQRRKEVTIRVVIGDFLDRWVRQMIVVVMGDHHCIDNGDILDLTRRLSVALGTQPGERRTTILEDGVEQDPQTTGEFNVIARMA